MEEKVCIIVPVYKVEKYLNRCIESIVNQTYRNLEIILVDDGSPDRCPQMCDEWAEKDGRIKVIHKENQGLGMARNSGIETASGDYLMFVDSDDYLVANAVEVLRDRMVRDGSDMAIGKNVDVYGDGTTSDLFCKGIKNETLTKDAVFKHIKDEQKVSVSAWGKLYKRSVFATCRYPRLTCGEDLWVFPQVVSSCEQISIVNENVYYYFQREDSIIHQKNDLRRKDEVIANLNFVRFLIDESFVESALKWFERTIRFLLEMNDRYAARKQIAEYLSWEERKGIFSLLPLKAKVKWLSLYVPGLYPVVHKINKRRCARNGK